MINRLKTWMTLPVMMVVFVGLFTEMSRAADEIFPFQAAGDDHRVVLRWTWPKNSLAVPDYKIYRQEEKTAAWQLLTPEPISIVRSLEKAEEVLPPEMVEKYAPLLFNSILDPQINPSDFRKVMQHMTEHQGMIMLAADIYSELADLLGVRYVDQSVTNGKTYTYRLAMIKNKKETIIGLSGPVTPGKKGVSPPRGFNGEARDSAAVHKWEVEPKFSAYDLYRSSRENGTYQKINTSPIVIVSSRDEKGNTRYPSWFYIDKNLKNGETYWYAIQGRDPFGRKSGFTRPIALIPLDNIPPKPPLKFHTDVQKDTVTLTWEKNTEDDLAGYNIYRSTDYRTGFDKVNGSLISTTTYADESLSAGKNWWYYVTAMDKDGNESPRSYTALAHIRDYIPPDPPAGLTGKSAPGKAFLAWKPGMEKDLKGYRIYQSMNKYAGHYHLLNREPVKKPAYIAALPKTADASPYFYKITAVDNAGNESAFSGIIEIQLPDVTPPLPPAFKAVVVQEGKIILSWHANTEIDLAGYNLFRNKKNSPEDKGIKLNEKRLSKNSTTFTDTVNRINGTRYIYTLEAVDESGNPSRRSRPLTAATYDETPPGPPAYVKTQALGGEIIKVSWKQPDNDDLNGVMVFRAEKEEGPFYPVTAMIKDTVFLDANVRQGKTYYYRIAAFDRSSNRSEYSKVANGAVENKNEK